MSRVLSIRRGTFVTFPHNEKKSSMGLQSRRKGPISLLDIDCKNMISSVWGSATIARTTGTTGTTTITTTTTRQNQSQLE